MGAGPRPVIQRKLSVPPVAERLVSRPRVSELLAGLIADHGVVWVCATAGAGKTTAVVQALERVDRPIAWLTLDETDAAPGRLLTYLEAAVGTVVPAAAEVATGALAGRIPHAEAAGLLAEACGDAGLLLVIDGMEQLAGSAEALSVLSAFVRYAPESSRVALVTRVELPFHLQHPSSLPRVASIGESDLAFTPAEAAEVLANAGHTTIDPARAVEVTGGWVTGLLFEAWRSNEHVVGVGGEADPLHGYLASQILRQLEPAERDFLEQTSLLDEVTAPRAEALGLRAAGDRLIALRAKHLPVSWVADGRGMRCHPRFREYLLERLQRRGGDEVRRVRLAYGELLLDEGLHEEAADHFLSLDAPDRALVAAELAIGGVIARMDFAVAERWIAELATVPGSAGGPLTEAELMLAIGREDFGRGGRIADGLAEAGIREAMARESSMAASMMAWCYWHLGRIEDARSVIAVAEPSAEVDALLYLLALVRHDARAGEPFAPALTGSPLDALVMRVHYAHGRLPELTRSPTSSWAAAVSAPWRIGALRAMGRLEEALELYRAAPDGRWSQAWMHGIVGAELMIDLEALDETEEELRRGAELIRASGSIVFDMLHRLIDAKRHLRLRGDPQAALAILDALEREGQARRYDFIAEILDTWRGLALLMSSPDADAVTPLRRAVESMLAAHRILELPTASVLLAEAHWRRGDEEAADRAADCALAAAREQGSNHQLLLALADFPAVLARRLDAEPAADSPWHELGRALMARGVPLDPHVATTVTLAEFGRLEAMVDGRPVRPRIAKSMALLAYLAGRPRHEARREELLEALFDGRADESARAYLRQAVHRLREAMPDGIGPAFESGVVRFQRRVVISADSGRFESLLVQASRLRGEARLATLLEALELIERGEYLPGLDASWVAERRTRLEMQAGDVRLEAAQLAFAAGRYQEAERLVTTALDDDPLRESGWRLLMRIANVTGDEDGVIAAYDRCRTALGDLGAAPSGSTQQLLERLRR